MLTSWRSSLDLLEAESIAIFREVVARFDRPVLLFSGGKDSAVMLHLAEKALAPMPLPFPLLHVATGHDFPELIAYRDRRAAQLGAELLVGDVDAALREGRIDAPEGPDGSRNRLQIPVLLKALADGGFDAVFGGARRDEERARAKERIFSFRDHFGGWQPRQQRPELWRCWNVLVHPGEHMRVFPLSDWTEVDIWRYIDRENIELPSLYYAHERTVVERNGQWLAVSDLVQPRAGETVRTGTVRFRTLGDQLITGAIFSDAADAAAVAREVAEARTSERGDRADDRVGDAAMEDRKRQGYF